MSNRKFIDDGGEGRAIIGADGNRDDSVGTAWDQGNLGDPVSVDTRRETCAVEQGIAGRAGVSCATDRDRVRRPTSPSLGSVIHGAEIAIRVKADAQHTPGDPGFAVVGVSEAAAIAPWHDGRRSRHLAGIEHEEADAIGTAAARGCVGKGDLDTIVDRQGCSVNSDTSLAGGVRCQNKAAVGDRRVVRACAAGRQHEATACPETADDDRERTLRVVQCHDVLQVCRHRTTGDIPFKLYVTRFMQSVVAVIHLSPPSSL